MSESNPICAQCERVVSSHQEALQCDVCEWWTHRRCGTAVIRTLYNGHLESRRTTGKFNWTCSMCRSREALRAIVDTGEEAGPPPEPPPLCNGALVQTTGITWVNTESSHFAPIRLHFAINSGNIDRIQELISGGTDLNFVIHRGGTTPLTLAILRQSYDVAKMLIDAGADVTIAEATQWRRQPIHLAAAATSALEVTEAIVSKCPATLSAVDGMLFTPLHHAAIAGNISAVMSLICHGAQVDALDDRGRSPLFRAVEHGHVNVVDALLGAGANVNAVDSFGWTPIYQSTLCGQIDMVGHLLHCGAHVRGSRNPEHHADAGSSHQTAYRVGIPIHAAAGGATPDVFIKLREVGVDFYLRQRRSATPCVHQAASYSLQTGQSVTQLTKLLLDFGADVNDRDGTDDRTAIYHALMSERRDVVHLLVSAGAGIENEQWVLGKQWPPGVTDLALCEWLHLVASSGARQLATLCRLVIRRSVHPPISASLTHLPLPDQLVNFLQLDG